VIPLVRAHARTSLVAGSGALGAVDVAGVHADGPVACQVLGRGDGSGDVVDEVVGRLGVPALGFGPVGHHDDVVAAGG
jgi:hypothetical protein